MKLERRKFTNAFKAEAVFEALKEKPSIAPLAESTNCIPPKIQTGRLTLIFLTFNEDVFKEQVLFSKRRKRKNISPDLQGFYFTDNP